MTKGDQDFEEHVRTRAVKPPDILYKYTTVDTARTLLSNGTLRFQSPLRYNDPLDSQWDPFWPIHTPEAREYERALVEKALRNPASWPANSDPEHRQAMEVERRQIMDLPCEAREAAILEFANDAVANFVVPEPIVRKYRDIRRRMRVLCLGECERSLLMWSHYAERHEGIVLGFDVGEMEKRLRRPLEQIRYCDHPPRLIDSDAWSQSSVFGVPHPDMQGREREWALTKHSGWGYEREWRFVWIADRGTQGEYEDIHFPPSSLVEIVSGCHTDTARFAELMVLARKIHSGVKRYQMSIHPSRFELIKNPVEDA